METDNIKLYDSSPVGFAFSEPNIDSNYEFNFSSEWILNPNNSEGVSIENSVVKITKVKPNTWFMRSNYGFTTDAERNEKFYGKEFVLNGISKANSDGFIIGHAAAGYNGYGIVVSPCTTSGGFMSSEYPWDMGIPGGSFKLGPQGSSNYGYTQDCTRDLYNYNVSTSAVLWWSGPYWEVGFAFYSDFETDADGYITFNTPITIGCTMASQFIDPTTKEAFTVALGKDTMFEKEKNFENLLMNHQLAFLDNEVNEEGKVYFGETIQNSGYAINDGKDGKNYAYVISNNRCEHYGPETGKYKDTGMPISIPIPTDLFEMMEQGEPVKFFAQQTDRNKQEGLWYNVIKYFKEHDITSNFGASYLFAKSNINGSDYTDGDGWIDININCENEACIDGCFDHAGNGYRDSGVEKVRFTVKNGKITKAKDVFRFNKYRLKNVEFINEANPEEHVCPNQMSGMFEYCGLTEFPKGLGFSNGEAASDMSQTTCMIPYIAHNSAFKVFGNLKPDGSRYRLLVDNVCTQAFHTDGSPNDGPSDNLEEILVELDMKFVIPNNGYADNVFLCKNLKKARILNLNHGVWSLDNVNHSGHITGNIESLDEESTNFLLNNVFDLKLNATHTVEDGHEYEEGLLSSKLYLPLSLKEKASEDALRTAAERGWDVYFGGELAEVGSMSNTLDVVFANKTSDEHELVIVSGGESAWQNYPKSNWEPIGVVVIPESHGVLKNGDGSKNQCGVMSLAAMNYDTPENGGTSNQLMHWGGYNMDISGKSDNLDRFDSVSNGLVNYDVLISVGGNGSISETIKRTTRYSAYLPSDAFSMVKNPYDDKTWYQTNDSTDDYIPSPYKNDGSYNPIYSQITSPGSPLNAMSDFNGIANTKIITDLATGQVGWKTESTITNNSGSTYYPAACCCGRFKTIGTKAFVDCSIDELREGSGFWYLPSCGELGYVVVRRKAIDDTISKLNTAYGVGVQVGDLYYWSSSEYSDRYARYADEKYGGVNNLGKNGRAYVRAFMRL